MQSKTTRSELFARPLRWACCLAALLLADPAAAADLYPGAQFPAGGLLVSLAVADLDGDGVLDLAAADEFGDAVKVLLGDGDGSFQAAVSYPAGARPGSIAVADLDGDGDLDLVTADQGEHYFIPPVVVRPAGRSVLLGNGDGSFQPAVSYPADVGPASLAVADLDGDGALDLVTANALSDDVSVLRGNGDGSFQPAVSYPAGDYPTSVAVADLDADGVPDVVTVHPASDDVSVLLGNGDGSFQPAVSYPAGHYPRPLAVADLDGDGVPDLASAYVGDFGDPSGVSVLLGNGDGTFQPAVSYPVGVYPQWLAVADLDADAVPDVVTANPASGDVSVLLGNGDGSFQPAVSYPAGLYPQSLAVADLDSDAVPDLIIANATVVAPGGVPILGSAYVRVLLGNGDGSFPAAVELPTGDEAPTHVVVADLDADTVADLVSANPGGSTPMSPRGYVSVLRGNGDGSFQDAVSFPAGASPNWVSVADLDGDGILDLVTANSFSNDVSVLRGNGDGSFQDALSFPTGGSSPRSVAVADLDGDGVLDLVTGHLGGGAVSVLLGNGDGSFQDAVSYPAGVRPVSVAVADLDGDGVPDVVSANSGTLSGSGEVSVLRGNGDGSLQAALSFPTGSGSASVAVADLDGDGALDLVTANSFSDDVSVLLGNGDGSFQDAVSYPAGDYLTSVAVADLDGDGVPDLVAADEHDSAASVLLGNGDGSFQAARFFGTGFDPVSVAVADLDDDSLPDLVTANTGSEDLTVLFHLGEGMVRPEIDIRPWRDPNVIYPFSRLLIPVALLGSDDFDVADVDVTTLAFGPGQASAAFDLTNPWVYFFSQWDVNGDHKKDLLSYYWTEETGIAMGHTEACLTGETLDSRPFEGCDAITTRCGQGFEAAFVVPPLVWVGGAMRRRRLVRV